MTSLKSEFIRAVFDSEFKNLDSTKLFNRNRVIIGGAGTMG